MLRVTGAVCLSLVCMSHGGDAGADEPAEAPGIVEAAALPIHAIWGDKVLGDRVLSESKFYRRLEHSRAICFGETHNSAAHHYAQLRALRALTKNLRPQSGRHSACGGRQFALGFEMFQRPFQP